MLNGSKYCYVSQTIQIKHQSFVYTQLNDQFYFKQLNLA